MADVTVPRKATFIDRVVAWVLALLLGLMGVPMVVGIIVESLQPQPEGTRSGFT